MAINIDTLVQNEFGRSATDQLGKIIGNSGGNIQSGVDRAITEVLDGLSLMARDEAGRQSIYDAARYCDDGLIDDPAVFFAGRDQRAAIESSNNSLGALVGIGRRDSISQAVQSAANVSSQDADTITGYVTPGVLGVMKRQMLNGAVLDNSDGIGQMLLGETTTAVPGGAAQAVDHSVPKYATRQTHTQASSTGASAAAGSAAVAHGDDADHSWLFRWMLPLLLLGGLVIAGLRGCGIENRVEPVAVVDTSMQTELDGLKDQVTTLTSERDVALSDTSTAVSEIERLKGELATVSASAEDTSALDAANTEIVSLKDQLAISSDTGPLDDANVEIMRLKEELAKPTDTGALDDANAEIARLKEELAKPADTGALDDANAEIARLQEELAKPADNTALNNATAEISRLQTALASVPPPEDNSAEIMGLQKQVDDGSLKVAQLEAELGTVRENRDELEALMARNSAEKTQAEGRSAELKEKLLAVAGAKNRMEASMAISTEEKAQAGSRIAELKEKLLAVAGAKNRMEVDLNGLNQAVIDGEAANADKSKQIEQLSAQLDKAGGEMDALKGDLTGLTADRDRFQKQVSDLEAELATVTGERDSALGKIEVVQSNLGRAVDDASAKRKAFVGAQDEILSLKKSLADGEESSVQLESQIAKLQKGRSWAMAAGAKETAKLRTAQSQLEEQQAAIAAGDKKLAMATDGRSAAVKAATNLLAKLRAAEAERDALAETDAKLAKVTKGRAAAINTVTDLVGKLRAAEAERDRLAESDAKLAKVTKGRAAAISTVTDLVGKLRAAEAERAALASDKQGLEQGIADAEAAMQAKKDQVLSVSSTLADQLNAAGLGAVSVKPVEDDMAVGITMGSSDLYGVGSASLSPQGVDTLEALGSIVSEYPDWRIDVEGHTDAQPIGEALRKVYASNWELSVARAAAAVRYLQSRTGIAAEKMSVRGFGEHKPVATNETAEGREENRRIELILRRDN